MYRNLKVVPRVVFGRGCFDQLDGILEPQRTGSGIMVFILDDFFEGKPLEKRLPLRDGDLFLRMNVDDEPKTKGIDALCEQIRQFCGNGRLPDGVIGIGGGSVLDTAKAVSLMLTNPGEAHEYQGWDLIQFPAIYHVGIPTLAGTGAEVSRTAVLTGPVRKLGLNSDHTVFDQVILDPDLLEGVQKNIPEQWFWTGMDCYIHNVEALCGTFVNEYARAFGEQSQVLCREVFLDHHPESDEKLMMASYFGGMSIAYSQVGACHALSYGLSYVLGLHHGIANSIVFDYLEDIYPEGVKEFRAMAERNNITIPRNLTSGLSEAQMEKMVEVSTGMVPLWENCLGKEWQEKMPKERMRKLFNKM
ncbi:iron-containing alcohol dehydrogenase family protein [Desulfobotulus sp. H1]|uniref:Iron-containing alcohol dehydrogenase family protein n=1 Tax=Desulfobotulus pelophilus TaxID=2823377 RepID=A0ABT3N896_9BACT|nr:iron-containing alcohol dehydrogenase family protein [Desulfobotulus pelophilus]MCW7753674.1 iron-containing alcohol dehydrogenase family protein [Desulfobotulus pelophilus]